MVEEKRVINKKTTIKELKLEILLGKKQNKILLVITAPLILIQTGNRMILTQKKPSTKMPLIIIKIHRD
jgi:hypothetical protein